MLVSQEKGEDFIVLKGMGRAINKTVTVAEIVKRRVAGLHQDTEVSSLARGTYIHIHAHAHAHAHAHTHTHTASIEPL